MPLGKIYRTPVPAAKKAKKALRPMSKDKAQDKQILKLTRRLNQLPVPEIKFHTQLFNVGANVATYSGHIIDVTGGITNGTTDSGERIGDKIYATALDVSMNINPGSGSTYSVCNVALVKCKSKGPLTVFSDYWTPTGLANAVNGNQVQDAKNEYRTLAYKRFPMIDTNYGRLWHRRLKLNFPIEFVGGLSTIDRNAIVLCVWSDQVGAGNLTPELNIKTKLYFKDP